MPVERVEEFARAYAQHVGASAMRMRRTCVVELVVDEDVEEKLRQLCTLSMKLWDEVNYARLRMFLERKYIDFKGTYKEFYEKYKPLIGSATVQTILLKNSKTWKGFLRLLELKRGGISPPGNKKKRRNSRGLWAVLRKDQYRVDCDKIIIKGLGAIGWIEVGYKGPIHLRGEQGKLEVRYDTDRKKWYAHISFEVSEKAVRGVWTSIPKKPKGDLVAGIDVGVNNLMAIYVENGSSMLVNGRPLKAITYYWRMKIAKYQSMLNKYGLRTSRKLRLMYTKWKMQAMDYINAKVRQAIEWLYDIGVSTIKVGYPRNIIHENGNFENAQVWHYGYLIRRIIEVAEEHGIEVILVNEAGTSSKCPIHGDGCGRRITRGLFKCTRLNRVFNADLVAAYNILATPITLSPERGRGNGPETRPGIEPSKEGM